MGIDLQDEDNVPATNASAHDTAKFGSTDTWSEYLTEPEEKFKVGGAAATGVKPHQLAFLQELFV